MSDSKNPVVHSVTQSFETLTSEEKVAVLTALYDTMDDKEKISFLLCQGQVEQDNEGQCVLYTDIVDEDFVGDEG